MLLSATVTRVQERRATVKPEGTATESNLVEGVLGKRLVLEVDIDHCCRAHIAPDKVHSVISQEVRSGDRVTWWGNMHGPQDQGQRMFGTVLYVEPAGSATGDKNAAPGRARALVKPDGVTTRPQIEVSKLSRVDPVIS